MTEAPPARRGLGEVPLTNSPVIAKDRKGRPIFMCYPECHDNLTCADGDCWCKEKIHRRKHGTE